MAEWIKKFALVGVSTCVTFLSAELFVRYMIPAWPFEPPLYIPDHLSARDASLRWRFSSAQGLNSLGLRNREVVAKPRSTLRILFLGDSLLGGQTSSGTLFTELLEQRLNARSVDELQFEVINAGNPGYTTYQELEFLKLYGLNMEPDIVVLGFVFNDVFYKYYHRPTKERLLNREPAAHLHHFNTDSFPGLLFARSHLAHQLVSGGEILWKRIVGRTVFPFETRGDFYLAWKDYGWNHARRLLGEMHTLLRDRSVPLMVIVFPMRDQVNHEYRKLDEAYVLYPQQRIQVICNDYGILMLDLTDTVYREGGVTLFEDHLHLNRRGNDVVANELEIYLVNFVGTGVMKTR